MRLLWFRFAAASWVAAGMLLCAAMPASAFVTLKDGWGYDIKWKKASIPWYMHPNGSADVSFSEAQQAVAAGLAAWDAVPCFNKSFSYGGTKSSDPEDGIYIKFVESNWDPTVGDAAAYAQTWKSTGGTITNGVIVFNGVDQTWTTTEAKDYFSEKSDIQGVAAHESGHCLGLDHSRYREATMFFSGGTEDLRTLEQDDKDGLCYIYGSFTAGKPCDTCTKDSQCANGYCLEYPDGWTYCGKNCTSDASCPETFYCYDIQNGTDQCAAFNGYCSQEGANIPLGIYCYGNETCESGTCMALPDTAYCSKECTADSQCGSLKCSFGYCLKGGNTPLGGECQTHVECSSAMCVGTSPTSGVCTKPCTKPSDCPGGFGCVEGYCLKTGGKPYGAACTGGMECETLNCLSMGGDMGSFCSFPCEDSGDCPDNDPCTFEFCVPPGPTPFGISCQKHTDCATGLCKGSPKYCTQFCGAGLPACPTGSQCKNEGYCTKPTGPASVCASDADCVSTQFCKKASQASATGTCVKECNPMADAGCGAEEACKWHYIPWAEKVTGECVPAAGASLGAPCGGAVECLPNLVCINVGGTGTKCYRDCDVEKNLGCSSYEVCLSLSAPGDPKHGVCVCNSPSCATQEDPDVHVDLDVVETNPDTGTPDVQSPDLGTRGDDTEDSGVAPKTDVGGEKPEDSGGGGGGGCSASAGRGQSAGWGWVLLGVGVLLWGIAKARRGPSLNGTRSLPSLGGCSKLLRRYDSIRRAPGGFRPRSLGRRTSWYGSVGRSGRARQSPRHLPSHLAHQFRSASLAPWRPTPLRMTDALRERPDVSPAMGSSAPHPVGTTDALRERPDGSPGVRASAARMLCLAAGGVMLLALPAEAGAGDCCAGKVKLREFTSATSGITMSVPESWKPVVVEFSEGFSMEDGTAGCVLEIVRSPAVMSLESAAALYSRMYLGANRISTECALSVTKRMSWASQAVAGLFAQRDHGRWVHAVFGRAGDDLVVAQLRCPRKSDKEPDWAVAAAVFETYRYAKVRG